MNPAIYDITIHQGASLDIIFRPMDASGKRVNLTGFSAVAKARTTILDPSVAFDFTPTVETSVVDGASVSDIRLTVGKNLALQLQRGQYDWDLLLVDGSGFHSGPYIQGKVVVKPLASR